MMNRDGNDQVRAAAWDELQFWAQSPAMDEIGLSTLADGLKPQPANELLIRKKLCNRLAIDVKNGANTSTVGTRRQRNWPKSDKPSAI